MNPLITQGSCQNDIGVEKSIKYRYIKLKTEVKHMNVNKEMILLLLSDEKEVTGAASSFLPAAESCEAITVTKPPLSSPQLPPVPLVPGPGVNLHILP